MNITSSQEKLDELLVEKANLNEEINQMQEKRLIERTIKEAKEKGIHVTESYCDYGYLKLSFKCLRGGGIRDDCFKLITDKIQDYIIAHMDKFVQNIIKEMEKDNEK